MANISFTVVVFSMVAILAFIGTFSTAFNLCDFVSNQTYSYTAKHSDADVVDILWLLLWNLLLLAVFVVQHSGMASQWWRDTMADFSVGVIDRALYVVSTCITLQLLMQRWQLIPVSPVWLIDTTDRQLLGAFFFFLHLVMWVILYGACLTMDLPELMGIKQVYYHSLGLEHPLLLKSRENQRLYKHMRHPGTTCFMILLWVHPVMTLERLLLALVWTLYLLFGHSVRDKDYVYLRTQYERKRTHYVVEY